MARTNKYTSFNFNDIFDKSTTPSSSTTSTSRSPSSPSLSHKSYSLSASSRLSHGGMLLLSRPSQPKPKPKPKPQAQAQPQAQPQPPPPQQPPQPAPNSLDFPAITSSLSSKPLDSDSLISLRPQGKTGGLPSFHERELNTTTTTTNNNNNKVDVSSPKSNKFVPPHLRPGYVPKEVPPVPEFQKPKAGTFHHRPGSSHGNFHGSANGYPDNGRPMSGGGGGGYHRPGSAHGNYYHGSNIVYVDDGRPKSGGGGGYDRRMRGGHGAPPHLAGVESESSSMNRPRSGGSRPNSRG